jgi:hypothetical protein
MEYEFEPVSKSRTSTYFNFGFKNRERSSLQLQILSFKAGTSGRIDFGPNPRTSWKACIDFKFTFPGRELVSFDPTYLPFEVKNWFRSLHQLRILPSVPTLIAFGSLHWLRIPLLQVMEAHLYFKISPFEVKKWFSSCLHRLQLLPLNISVNSKANPGNHRVYGWQRYPWTFQL